MPADPVPLTDEQFDAMRLAAAAAVHALPTFGHACNGSPRCQRCAVYEQACAVATLVDAVRRLRVDMALEVKTLTIRKDRLEDVLLHMVEDGHPCGSKAADEWFAIASRVLGESGEQT